MTCFCFCAVYLKVQREPESRPQIVILGCVQEVTFHDRTVWYVDYLIDGYPRCVTLYAESDIEPFMDALEQSGNVRSLHD